VITNFGTMPTFVAPTGVGYFEATGQSYQEGFLGTPPLSTVQYEDNQLLDYASGTLGDLVNASLEAPIVPALNQVASMQAGDQRLIAQNWAVGGSTLTQISDPGTGVWGQSLTNVAALPAGAVYLGSLMSHAFADRAAGTTPADYFAALRLWQTARQTALAAETSQSHTATLYLTQLGYEDDGTSGATELLMALGQLRYTQLYDDAVLVGPTYPYPITSDDIHLTNEGYRWFGEMHGKVIQRHKYEGRRWRPLHADRCIAAGNTVLLRYFVPAVAFGGDSSASNAPSLRFDTSGLVPSAPDGNFGFRYIQNGGPARTITDVDFGDREGAYQWVIITLNDTAPTTAPTNDTWGRVTAGPAIGYADFGEPPYATTPTPPRGQLCDYDATPALESADDLRNWACTQQLLITRT